MTQKKKIEKNSYDGFKVENIPTDKTILSVYYRQKRHFNIQKISHVSKTQA